MTNRILIMAGGTGGHVFPALAVADELRSRNDDIFWMGTAKGIEAKLVPGADYPLNCISVQGLRGNGLLGWLLAPFKIVKAIFEALTIIKKINPDVVLGLGGFASGPGGIAAWLLRKPLIIHEQNAIPGLTNRILSCFAKQVLQGFPQSFSASCGAVWIGNPVRSSIESLASPDQRFADRTGALRLLILGGSLGAKSLNTVVPTAIALIKNQQIDIKHQCGSRHIQDCHQAYKQAGVTAEVTAFIDDMAQAYAWADLVICRAGALTIAELAAAGVATILVPYPYAVDDHQTVNAATLVNVGAAKLIAEKTLTAELLAEQITLLSHDRKQLLVMANAAQSQAKIGAANNIANICQEYNPHISPRRTVI